MEWVWYIIAALGAGIGTGLAGLSAATVMVPIMIVLCPSFAGETGAYQATAIALASDILGSAVTTYTYAKHGNIDLKRGWIMLVCILTMCVVGSYAAFMMYKSLIDKSQFKLLNVSVEVKEILETTGFDQFLL